MKNKNNENGTLFFQCAVIKSDLNKSNVLPIEIINSKVVKSESKDKESKVKESISKNETKSQISESKDVNSNVDLDLHIMKAENLISYDSSLSGGKSDPYCKIFIIDNHTKKEMECGKTKVIMNNLNPEWNEHIKIENQSLDSVIRICLYDKDKLSDDYMGKVEITMDEVSKSKDIFRKLIIKDDKKDEVSFVS